MTPFAVRINWSGRPVPAADAEHLLTPIASRCGDGRTVAVVPGCAVSVGLTRAVQEETVFDGLAIDRDECWVAAGDVRLYDKTALVDALGDEAKAESDIALLVRAYRRFGAGILTKTAGDFAVVIWDWREHRVDAFRDHLGIRPTYYRETPEGLVFASDVRQLLEVSPEDREPDARMALEFLLGRFALPGHTFFAHIKPVLPGHRLLATRASLRQERYWTPSLEPFQGTYLEAVEEWRHRFRRAVRDRLRSHRPIAAYLSGGLDSSSIVGAAHELFQGGEQDVGRPVALSALFPDLDCDESTFIGEVQRRSTTFDFFTWDGREPNPRNFVDPILVGPGLRGGIGGSPRRENAAMRDRDCRVVLKGQGGDSVAWSLGVLADLVRGGHLVTLLRELMALRSWGRAIRLLRLEAALALPFQQANDLPSWLSQDLLDLDGRGAPRTLPARGRSLVLANAWNVLGGSYVSFLTDNAVRVGADAGVEVRLPYLDVRLVEHVLTLDWHHRLPRGDVRRLQRDAIAPFLPDAVLGRQTKANFSTAFANQIRLNLPQIERILRGRPWLSARFVNQRRARYSLQKLFDEDPTIARPNAWEHLWRIAALEAWLRRVFGYDAAEERV